MKKLVLYFLLLMVVPATAQSGLFGNHPHHHSHAPTRPYHPGPLMHQNHHTPPVNGMSPENFEAVMTYLSKETFDSNRLDAAKQIVRRNWFSARQIASICKLFTYESNRLEFAKYAYASCVDKGMYFLLDETFTYKLSREELHEYIRER